MLKNFTNKLSPYIKSYQLSNNVRNFSFSMFQISLSTKYFSTHNTKDENLFIPEETNNDNFFPIQKKILDDLISESQEYAEYNSILQILRDFASKNEFSLDKFKTVVDYIIENQPMDSVMCKLFESAFLMNLNAIDYQTKSTSVLILGEQVDKKKLQFQEDHWMMILKDFQNLVDYMSFQDYYNYVNTFDRLFTKRTSNEVGKYYREFENFVSSGNLSIFNSGCIKINKVSDMILFSKMTHSGALKIGSISDLIWGQIEKVIQLNAHDMNIYEVLVATSLLINLHEVSGKANFLLSDAINEVNNVLYFMIKNFDLLELDDQITLVNHADNLFNYYILFTYMNGGDKLNVMNSFSKTNIDKSHNSNTDSKLPEDSFLQVLIRIYTSQIKNKEDLVIFKEFRVLHFLAREIKYKEIEFWNLMANKILECMSDDCIKIKNDIMPKKFLSNSSMSNEEKMRYLDKCNMQLLVYIGMIMETFGNVNYTSNEFWEAFLQKVDEFVNFKNKDLFTVLNFISLGCRKIYRKDIFADVWSKLIGLMDPKLKHILKHKEIVDFIIKVNTYSSKNESINVDELNICLNKLFLTHSEQNEVTPIKLFTSFFGLMESKVKEDDKILKIFSNVLVDLLKLLHDNKQSGFDLLAFKTRIGFSTIDKMSLNIRERILSLLRDSDMNDENEISVYTNLIKKLVDTDILNQIDVAHIRFILQKENKLDAEKIASVFKINK